MIDVLIIIVVLAIIFGLIFWALGMVPLPAPFMNIAKVACVLIFVLLLLGMMFGGIGVPALNLRR